DAQIDQAMVQYGGNECETDTEFLELDRRGHAGTGSGGNGDRYRKLPACQEACGVARKCDKIRFCEASHKSFCFQRTNHYVDICSVVDQISQYHAKRLASAGAKNGSRGFYDRYTAGIGTCGCSRGGGAS